jgi:hypothetical protein
MHSRQSGGSHSAIDRRPILNACRLLGCALVLTAIGSSSAITQDAIPSSSSAAGVLSVHEDTPRQGVQKPHVSNTVAYWFGSSYRTPFVLKPNTFQAADIQRNSLEYTHVDSWKLGSNFADVMVNQSNMAEPAAGGGTGATEVYVTLRSDVGMNEITQSGRFRFGPVRDVAMEVGANLEAKNSSYAPAERTIYVGPKFQFELPRGYVNAGLHLRKEWNHEGVLGKSENYDPNFNIEANWMVPFALGKLHLACAGFADYNTQKGKDSFGTQTVPEFLVRSAVSVDAGQFLFLREHLLDLAGGLWYWHNEYGKPASIPGAMQVTPFVGVVYHLDGGRGVRKR